MSFGESNLQEAIAFTQQAGLNYLYHEGPFETWGHFKLNSKEFPNNWSSLEACVEKAKAQHIKLGVHTLSNFITTNDPYVTPVPDKRLAKVGVSQLTENIDEATKEITIKDPGKTQMRRLKKESIAATTRKRFRHLYNGNTKFPTG